MVYRGLVSSFVILLTAVSQAKSDDLIFREKSDTTGQLRNFAYDLDSDSLYVAGIDVIYRLNVTGLSELGHVSTSGVDNLNCSYDISQPCCPEGEQCNYTRSASPNINQALVIDKQNNALIACGTLYYGSCERRNLADLSTFESRRGPVVTNDERQRVVSFMGPGADKRDIVYFGTPYSSVGLDRYLGNYTLIAARDPSTLNLAYGQYANTSAIHVLPNFKQTYPIRFVSGFHRGGYIYFIIERQESSTVDLTRTYILRFCTGDAELLPSLIELQLDCTVDGKNYFFSQDAVVGKYVRRSDGLEIDALFAAFKSAGGNIGGGATNSAVCVYLMNDIDATFKGAVDHCFDGQGSKGPEYLAPVEQCLKVAGVGYILLIFFVKKSRFYIQQNFVTTTIM